MNLQEAKRIIENHGYKLTKTKSIDEAIKLRAAKRIAENAGYKVVNENDLTNYANGRLINEFTDLSYEDYRAIVKDHLVRLGLDRATAAEYIMSYAESIEDNYDNEIDAVDTAQEIFDSSMDESCCDEKKKGKKKGKKSDFVPFWAKKKKINERFGFTDGTTFTSICEKYLADDYITALVKEIGLEAAKEEFLADVREYIGHGISETYYKTFAARIRNQSLISMIYSISNAMHAGQGNDLNAGTPRSAAARRNRRGPNAARNRW